MKPEQGSAISEAGVELYREMSTGTNPLQLYALITRLCSSDRQTRQPAGNKTPPIMQEKSALMTRNVSVSNRLKGYRCKPVFCKVSNAGAYASVLPHFVMALAAGVVKVSSCGRPLARRMLHSQRPHWKPLESASVPGKVTSDHRAMKQSVLHLTSVDGEYVDA